MLARKNILDITPYEPGKPIEEVQRELGLKEVIKMASNENPFGPSPKAIDAMAKRLKDVNRYPDASCYYLKERLARQWCVKPSNLIVGNGSDELIILALKAFLNEGEEVIIADTTFLIYRIASQVSGAKIITVPMKDFRYDLKAIKKMVTDKTKIVFIANPDNPTGTYVTKLEVGEFMDGLPEGLLVFFDEAYYEFGSLEKDYPDTLKFINKGNVITTRTFSKAYGLSGLRVGYGISSPEVIDFMNRVREPFNVNLLAQAGALAALDDSSFLMKTLEGTKRGREFLCSEFKRLSLDYVPSAANFVLVDIKKDSWEAFKHFLEQGVIVRDMKAWGLNTHIRVTVGTQEQNKRFVEILRTII
ncbi:MAG: histidinol-phosphate transaminase [Candidatus Omnitrophota bacterium]